MIRFFITITSLLLLFFASVQIGSGNFLFQKEKKIEEEPGNTTVSQDTIMREETVQPLHVPVKSGGEIVTTVVSPLPKPISEGVVPLPSGTVHEQKKEVVVSPPPEQLQPHIELGELNATVIINLTNKERQSRGMMPLYRNHKLDNSALKKALDMLEKQYFAHDSPSGVTVEDLANAVGYDFVVLGENLAYGNFDSDQEMVTGWMNSPPHRANILGTKYTEIGVAVVKGTFNGKEVWMGVQEFGKPTSACPQVDESLKENIEAGNAELDILAQKITEKKTALQAAKPETDPTYNTQVDDINALVAEHNALVQKIKAWISQYNKSVADFNLCAKM